MDFFGLEEGWIANAVEILAARPRPRLFEIRKLSSITRFDNESQKKVASLPILVLDSRSRFSDLSFHSQLWRRYTRRKLMSGFFWVEGGTKGGN